MIQTKAKTPSGNCIYKYFYGRYWEFLAYIGNKINYADDKSLSLTIQMFHESWSPYASKDSRTTIQTTGYTDYMEFIK